MRKARLVQGDLPEEALRELSGQPEIALDCEMMGLNPIRDRLCVVQISAPGGPCYLLQIDERLEYPNLREVLESEKIIKIFHFARLDCLFLRRRLNIIVRNIFCTKIASKIARTFTDKHGLKELVREIVGVNMDKSNQTSDWGRKELKADQILYAEEDVKHLFKLKEHLSHILKREDYHRLARDIMHFLPVLVEMDACGFSDVFEH